MGLRPIKTIVLFAAIILTVRAAHAADFIVIAHEDVVQDSLDHNALKNIYLGKKTRWDNDEKIVPVMIQSGKLRTEFIDKILKKSNYQFETYWKQMIFTGKGLPPKSFKKFSELIQYIAETPGAIGFVPVIVMPEGVKIIFIE